MHGHDELGINATTVPVVGLEGKVINIMGKTYWQKNPSL